MTDAAAILAEYGIEIVGRNVAPKPGQTRAIAALDRILRRHGAAHLRLVLTTLAETENNSGLLEESVLWMASDMVLVCPKLIESQTSEWLELWDAMPLESMAEIAKRLAGIVPLRLALGGMVYERIYRRFGGQSAGEIDEAKTVELAEHARRDRTGHFSRAYYFQKRRALKAAAEGGENTD